MRRRLALPSIHVKSNLLAMMRGGNIRENIVSSVIPILEPCERLYSPLVLIPYLDKAQGEVFVALSMHTTK